MYPSQTIISSEIPPENYGEKFCRLDINMTVNGQLVNLEIQVRDEGDYPERVLYHWAREYSSSLPAGGKYKDLPRTVIISIVNFNQFDCPGFHSEFRPLEVKRHELLSDKMSLHFFELKKVPVNDLNVGNKLLLWLSLFKAETEEDLEKIKAIKEPTMEKAINAYQTITVTPEFREAERMRAIARHNEASALSHAKDEGRQEGMEKGRQEGREEERQKWQTEKELLCRQIAELKAKLEG